MTDNFKEVNPSIWKYEKDGDSITGTLVRKQENVGTNESMMYSIETSEGVKDCWGAAILDQRMVFVNVGDKVRITYKGLSEKKAKGKNPAKIFKVEVEKAEVLA